MARLDGVIKRHLTKSSVEVDVMVVEVVMWRLDVLQYFVWVFFFPLDYFQHQKLFECRVGIT